MPLNASCQDAILDDNVKWFLARVKSGKQGADVVIPTIHPEAPHRAYRPIANMLVTTQGIQPMRSIMACPLARTDLGVAPPGILSADYGSSGTLPGRRASSGLRIRCATRPLEIAGNDAPVNEQRTLKGNLLVRHGGYGDSVNLAYSVNLKAGVRQCAKQKVIRVNERSQRPSSQKDEGYKVRKASHVLSLAIQSLSSDHFYSHYECCHEKYKP